MRLEHLQAVSWFSMTFSEVLVIPCSNILKVLLKYINLFGIQTIKETYSSFLRLKPRPLALG